MLDECGKTPTEKGDILIGKKVYRPPLPSTYNEAESLEYFNDGIEWVVRDYRTSLKEAKEPRPLRNNVMVFDVQTSTTEL